MRCDLKFALITVLAGTALVLPVFAGPEPIRPDYSKDSKDKNIVEQVAEPACNWYVSIGGGKGFDYGATHFNSRKVISGAFGLAELDAASHDFNDVYDLNYRAQLEFGYALGQHVELFGRFTYDGANGTTTTGSRVRSIGGRVDLESDWDDYSSYGGEVGIRYFFLPRRACLRPFISFSGGITRVESISVSTRARNNFGPITDGETLFDGRFYGSSVVATASVLAGVEFSLTRCFAIGVDAGLRYQSKLAQDDDDLDHAEFAGF